MTKIELNQERLPIKRGAKSRKIKDMELIRQFKAKSTITEEDALK